MAMADAPMADAAHKRTCDECDGDADAREQTPHAYAVKLLNETLQKIRPASRTQTAAAEAKLLVDHWNDRLRVRQAKESGAALERASTGLSSAQRSAKERLKNRVPNAAWNLVDDATPDEFKELETTGTSERVHGLKV